MSLKGILMILNAHSLLLLYVSIQRKQKYFPRQQLFTARARHSLAKKENVLCRKELLWVFIIHQLVSLSVHFRYWTTDEISWNIENGYTWKDWEPVWKTVINAEALFGLYILIRSSMESDILYSSDVWSLSKNLIPRWQNCRHMYLREGQVLLWSVPL